MMARIALTLALGLLPALAHAAPDAERRAVLSLLAHVHTPPTRAALEAASPRAGALLAALATDRQLPPWYRARAVGALATFPTDQTRRTLQGILQSRSAPELDKARALLALAAAFDVASLPTVQAALRGPSPLLADTAVTAMAKMRGPEAKASLRRHLPRELDAARADQIRKALSRRGGPESP